MANIIQGLVAEDGAVAEGSGFEVEIYDTPYGRTNEQGYILRFPNLNKRPTVICQAWEVDDAITCVTLGTSYPGQSPVEVVVATLNPEGQFRRTPFAFIAVSND